MLKRIVLVATVAAALLGFARTKSTQAADFPCALCEGIVHGDGSVEQNCLSTWTPTSGRWCNIWHVGNNYGCNMYNNPEDMPCGYYSPNLLTPAGTFAAFDASLASLPFIDVGNGRQWRIRPCNGMVVGRRYTPISADQIRVKTAILSLD